MNIFSILREKIKTIIRDINPTINEELLSKIAIETPKEELHGHYSTNAAMVIAKNLGEKPFDFANRLKEKLEQDPMVAKVEIAGPGFINLFLKPAIFLDILTSILNLKQAYGNSSLGKNLKVNIEFVSANPTGPMHIGHTRGAVYGDALARLLSKCSYNITKEYYVNDAGSQIDVLAKSLYLRYNEALGENIGTIPEGLYPGEYLKEVAANLTKKYANSLLDQDFEQIKPILKEFAVAEIMEMIKSDLKKLGVEHDVFFHETQLHKKGEINQAVEFLKAKNLVYRGTLAPPKGKLPDDWEEREQLLFKATDFGDDIDRPLQKSNGDWTYFAADLAYAFDKISRGFDIISLILGADHGGYIKRINAAIKALSEGKVLSDVRITQLVNLLKNGEPVKMSKRSGNFVTIDDVIEEVGKDVTRFVMLTRRNDQVIDFDLEKVKEESKDNPVFYVQYAHARCKSVLRNALSLMNLAKGDIKDISLIKEEEDFTLIRKMGMLPNIIELAAIHQEPHRIVFYLHELSSLFHALWAKGREKEQLKFIHPENYTLTSSRLLLVEAVTISISICLDIINVTPKETM